MYTRLDKFNTLPPKPEYIKKVRIALKSSSPVKLAEIVARTGLTNTQALCALDSMIKNGEATKERDSNSFLIATLRIEQDNNQDK